MLKRNLSFRARSAFFLIFVNGVVACDRAETGTGRTAEMRCLTDGLCWSPVGKRSFEGAYRRADEEIKFDAIFSPGRSAMTSFRDEWSYRLVDRFGHAFYTAPSSSPPDSWMAPETLSGRPPTSIDDEMTYLRNRGELAREMAQAIVSAKGPGGRLQQPWDELCRHLKIKYLEGNSFLRHEGLKRLAIDHDDMGGNTSSEDFSKEIPDDSYSEEIENEEEDEQEKILQNRTDESEDEKGEGGREDLLEEGEEKFGQDQSSSVGVASRLTSKFSAKLNKKTQPAEYESIAGREFQQELDLYWKHTRSLLVAGWKTAKHHSAACIRVYERPLGSQEPWIERDETCTENHGSKARSGGMMLYAECRDFPITKEYYAWKGECGGKYPTHVCNDDTALQIRHAYGEWDGGSKCLKRKRMHRPWCEKPW